MKRKKNIILIIVVLVVVSTIFLINTKENYSSFLSDDGQTYTYFEHDYQYFMVNDIEIGEVSREQLISCLSNNSVDIQHLGVISTAEDAAKKGAYVLNNYYENWTYDNNIGVFKNNKGDIWFVHGQVEQRGSKEKLGIVAFDARTGEVLGYDMIIPY